MCRGPLHSLRGVLPYNKQAVWRLSFFLCFPCNLSPLSSFHLFCQPPLICLTCLPFTFSDFNKTVADIPPCLFLYILFLIYYQQNQDPKKATLHFSVAFSLGPAQAPMGHIPIKTHVFTSTPVLLMSIYRLSSDGCLACLCLTQWQGKEPVIGSNFKLTGMHAMLSRDFREVCL